jgi:hypothetical protein
MFLSESRKRLLPIAFTASHASASDTIEVARQGLLGAMDFLVVFLALFLSARPSLKPIASDFFAAFLRLLTTKKINSNPSKLVARKVIFPPGQRIVSIDRSLPRRQTKVTYKTHARNIRAFRDLTHRPIATRTANSICHACFMLKRGFLPGETGSGQRSPFACGLKRSTQHSNLPILKRSVADETRR